MAYPRFLRRLFERNGAGPGLNPWVLPQATTTEQGVISPGMGIGVTDSGEAYITAHTTRDGDTIGRATGEVYGHVRLTDDFDEPSKAADGVAATPYMVKSCIAGVLNIGKENAGEQIITQTGTWKVPLTGTYRITCVGGGGRGGNAGASYGNGPGCRIGGSGGGGGAGQVIVKTVSLTKDTIFSVIVAGSDTSDSSGYTVFGTINDGDAYIIANGGGTGGDGGSAPLSDKISESAGGAPGVSHGTVAKAGGRGYWHSGVATSVGGEGGTSVASPYGDGGAGASAGTVSSFSPVVTGATEAGHGRGGCIKIRVIVVG